MSSNLALSDAVSSSHLISCPLALAPCNITPLPSRTEGSRRGEGTTPPAKIRKVEHKGNDSEEHDPAPDTTTSPLSSGKKTDNLSAENEESPSATPQVVSSPCTCHCGGCCCHGTSPEPQHCVRCHANYRLNHPEACMLPHVFTDPESWGGTELVYRDVSVPSTCCGSDVCGGDPRKGDWQQPSPCFMGWHTTNVEIVEEQYNGINVLRCDLDKGKCRRAQMKHSANYELLYDEEVSHTDADEGDRVGYLLEKRKEINDDDLFRDRFPSRMTNTTETKDGKRKIRRVIARKTVHMQTHACYVQLEVRVEFGSTFATGRIIFYAPRSVYLDSAKIC